ncbi:MAG: hypothetical protein OXP66_16105 [Candidatus Tectomicrobia bacterium]|nr:hypothetical protein [Candidatus Tectomicrobia bacterium]
MRRAAAACPLLRHYTRNIPLTACGRALMVIGILMGIPGVSLAQGGSPAFGVGQEARNDGLPRVAQEVVALRYPPEHNQVADGRCRRRI